MPDGGHRVRNRDTGEFWNWDPAAGVWRGGDDSTPSLDAPGPNDTGYWDLTEVIE